jgi:uncharacterized protein
MLVGSIFASAIVGFIAFMFTLIGESIASTGGRGGNWRGGYGGGFLGGGSRDSGGFGGGFSGGGGGFGGGGASGSW